MFTRDLSLLRLAELWETQARALVAEAQAEKQRKRQYLPLFAKANACNEHADTLRLLIGKGRP